MPDATEQAERERRGLVHGHLALVAVQLCFGLFPVFAIWCTRSDGWAPAALAFWRITCGAICLGGLAFIRYGRRAIPSGKDALILLVCSLLGVTANQVLYLEGVSRSTALHAGLVMGMIPIFTFVVAVGVRQERFVGMRALGVGVAFVGAMSWVFTGEELEVSLYGVGNLLMVANTLCYSIYLVISKPVLKRYPPLVVIAWVYIFALPTLPLVLGGDALWPDAPGTEALLGFAYTLVFATVAGYLLNMFALSHLRASTTAVYIYSQPLISGVAGMAILDEELTPAAAWAGACILVGIYLVSRRKAWIGSRAETDSRPASRSETP